MYFKNYSSFDISFAYRVQVEAHTPGEKRRKHHRVTHKLVLLLLETPSPKKKRSFVLLTQSTISPTSNARRYYDFPNALYGLRKYIFNKSIGHKHISVWKTHKRNFQKIYHYNHFDVYKKKI